MPTLAPVSAASAGIVALEIERDFAGDGEQLGADAAGSANGSSRATALRVTTSPASTLNIGLAASAASVSAVAKHGKTLAFAQRQEAGDLIDLGAGQNNGGDRAVARAGARLQRRRRQQLGAQIGRSIEQNPMLAVSGDSEASLRTRLNPRVARPSEPTHRTPTIPLRKSTTRRCTEDDGGQAPHSRGSSEDAKMQIRTRPGDSR